MRALVIAICALSIGCGNEPGARSQDAGASIVDGRADAQVIDAPPLRVTVRDGEKTFVRLATEEVVAESDAWDLAFTGWDVLTNGGVSGAANGGAFGPHVPLECAADVAAVPFVRKDATGGAFRRWYAYDGTTHALHSRMHVYGVRDGARTWKVQILGHYGEVAGAPTSAVYRVRWAEVGSAGASETIEKHDLDGTAGGTGGGKGACLDLGSGAVAMLDAEEARASSAWHLCFRRDAISVNGELGGPRGVVAVDLDAAATEGETVEQVAARTPERERARFDAVDAAALAAPSLIWRGDRVVSAFSDAWYAPATLAPAPACWIVIGADGASRFGVIFEAFEGASAAGPGVVAMRVRRFAS